MTCSGFEPASRPKMVSVLVYPASHTYIHSNGCLRRRALQMISVVKNGQLQYFVFSVYVYTFRTESLSGLSTIVCVITKTYSQRAII